MNLVTRGMGGALLSTGGMGFSSSVVIPPVVITPPAPNYGSGRSLIYDPSDYADFYKGPDLNKIMQDDLEITALVMAAISAGIIQ